jgi:hypothetical protein
VVSELRCCILPAEAVAYHEGTMHRLVRWLGICDGNMQEGFVPLRRERVGAPVAAGTAARHALPRSRT